MLHIKTLQYFLLKQQSAKPSSSGFTLVELIVAMLISSIVIGLVLTNFVQGMKEVVEDREKIAVAEVHTGVLQQIGDDIMAAGENIPEDTFPAIEFNDTAQNRFTSSSELWRRSFIHGTTILSNKIIIRRAVLKPLTLCQNIPINTEITNSSYPGAASNTLIVATDDLSLAEPGCRSTPLQLDPAAPVLPQILRDERNYRCKSSNNPDPSGLLGCNNTALLTINNGVTLALLSNKNGSYHDLVVREEIVNPIASGNEYKIIVHTLYSQQGNIANANYKIGNPIYIIEERMYALDDKGNINLYVNGSKAVTIASNIDKFQVSAELYSDRLSKTIQAAPSNPCSSPMTNFSCKFSSTDGDRWKDIAFIKIDIQKKYNPKGKSAVPSSIDLEKLSTTGKFKLINK
jgi:prepilin-type N-terminal cleavage/methylation domain-containing protein